MTSVLVCTSNRARSLGVTLRSIAQVSVSPELKWELIVVDNNSTDDTRAVVEEFANSSGLDVRYIFEPKQGKSHALNTGIREARGKIIALVDDDVRPASDWLEVIWREFSADPNLEVVSGRVELLNPADLPITIRRQSKRVVFQSLTDSFNVMVGCNAAVRRALFDRIGHFDVDLGPGSEFESAEDADFFFRAWRSGAKLVYEPSLFVFHDHGRRTQSAGVKVRRGYAVGRGAFYAKHLLQGDLLVLGAIRREVEWVLTAVLRHEGELGWRPLGWLLKGFFGYWRMRTARAIGLSRKALVCLLLSAGRL